MNRFIEGVDRCQTTLFPERLEDWINEDNPVRVIDDFVDGLDLNELAFERAVSAETGHPGYHPSVLLKLYIYGYLNRVQSSRRLEREAGRNVEVMWLTGRLVPDHKTIADFRKDNGPAIRKVCAQFVLLCRRLGLLAKILLRAILKFVQTMFTAEMDIMPLERVTPFTVGSYLHAADRVNECACDVRGVCTDRRFRGVRRVRNSSCIRNRGCIRDIGAIGRRLLILNLDLNFDQAFVDLGNLVLLRSGDCAEQRQRDDGHDETKAHKGTPDAQLLA